MQDVSQSERIDDGNRRCIFAFYAQAAGQCVRKSGKEQLKQITFPADSGPDPYVFKQASSNCLEDQDTACLLHSGVPQYHPIHRVPDLTLLLKLRIQTRSDADTASTRKHWN